VPVKQAFWARTFVVAALLLLASSASSVAAESSATYEFLLAKLAASEGSVGEALAGFERAEKLDAHSPYLRLEHAQLLARMVQVARRQGQQNDYRQQAENLVHQALEAAPGNFDVMRGAGGVYVLLAGRDNNAIESARSLYEQIVAQDPEDAQSAIILGRIYLEQQHPDLAVKVFRAVIERTPQQRAAYSLLVDALLQNQQNVEAEKSLNDLLQLDPDALDARLTLAELQSQRDDHAGALATLSAATGAASNDPRLRRELAWAYYLTGDLEHAIAIAIPLLESEPYDVQLTLLEGLVYSAQGKNAEAAEALSRVRGKRPGESALALALARVQVREGHYDDAAATINELITELDKSGKPAEMREARLELGQIYATAKQCDKAEAAVASLLHESDEPSPPTPKAEQAAPESDEGKAAAAPKSPHGELPALSARTAAVLLTADCALDKKEYDRALQVLPANDNRPAIVAKRSEVLIKSGKETAGQRELAALAARGEPQAVLTAAESYQRLEKYADSIPSLERLVVRDKDSVPAGFLLGAAYERTGKRQEAVAEFKRVLAIDPNFHAALNYLGYMWAEKGENLTEARQMIERAVTLEPDNGAYVDSLGWVYFRQGDFEQARRTLERATQLETTDPTVQEHLGDVYGALGKTALAGDAYRRAIALSEPGKADEVRRKLERLGGDTVPRR
jgi:tetratricopeptide (TPR) repeat protein